MHPYTQDVTKNLWASDIASIAASATDTTASRIIDTMYAEEISVQVYFTGHAAGADTTTTVNLIVSPDGTNWDTAATQILVTPQNGASKVSKTFLIDVRGYKYIKALSVVNDDADTAVDNVNAICYVKW